VSDEDRIDLEYKFSGAKYGIGWAKLSQDKALWVWVVFTVKAFDIITSGKDSVVEIIAVSGWIAVTIIFLLGNSFKRGFEQFLKNSKADVNVAVGTGRKV
jgi:hypothetical protein